jgi:hypothetical protein
MDALPQAVLKQIVFGDQELGDADDISAIEDAELSRGVTAEEGLDRLFKTAEKQKAKHLVRELSGENRPLFFDFVVGVEDCEHPISVADFFEGVKHPVATPTGPASKAAMSESWDAPLTAERIEKRDGVEIERSGAQEWRYFYKAGKLFRMEVTDPAIPGAGRMFFDGDGNEIQAA